MEDSAANSNTNFIPQDIKFHSNHILSNANGLVHGNTINHIHTSGILATNGPKNLLGTNHHQITT